MKKVCMAALFAAWLLFGCRQDNPGNPAPAAPAASAQQLLLDRARATGGAETGIALRGTFSPADTTLFAAVKEVNTASAWGISFWFGSTDSLRPGMLWLSPLREGSLTQSSVALLRLPGYSYDLLSYNSGDYYMGSAGGEVYAYLVDYSLRAVYYAHLTMDKLDGITLYLAPAAMPPAVRAFFTKTFAEEFPGVRLVNRDSGVQ